MDPEHRKLTLIPAILLAALFGFGCDSRTDPLTPEAIHPSAAKSSGNGGNADVVAGDLLLDPSDAPALLSTCPGTASPPGWSVVFGKTLCLIVKPAGKYANYEITDDIVLPVQIEKGKNGKITHIKLNGQDVDGPNGIWHDTDYITVAQPVVPSKAGFTLHVHGKNIQVWRYDSHLGDGKRVEMVGTISIGDVIYHAQ